MILIALSIHWRRPIRLAFGVPLLVVGAIALSSLLKNAQAQTSAGANPMTVRADIQEANSETGVITARGNVQVNYPARQLQATSAQAQYFSRERRLVLSGNVYVLQEGNSMRAETMTYLVDEGRFIATPKLNRQVESIYLVSDTDTAPQPKPTNLPPASPLNSQPNFPTPWSQP
jgi:lipopolysaccharide export system protein LptA